MAARLDPGTSPGPACAKCGAEKHSTGTRWRCAPCFNAYQAEWRSRRTPEQRRATIERQTAQRRTWTPERREAEYDRVRQWRRDHPDRYLEGARDWYARNADRARAAKLAEYYAAPEKFMARNLRRKARLRDAVCEHGPECVTAEFLADLYAAPCMYCGAPTEDADHFYPLARGGLHCVENLVPACGPCNGSKSHRDPAEWMASLGLSA